MTNHEIIEIPISQILLDAENPRHDVVNNQREAIIAMLDNQKDKLVRLAKDIVESGVNPAELPIVIPHDTEKDKYVVVEGNRRVTALKLLLNPTIASACKDKSLEKRFRELSTKFEGHILKALRCVILSDREEANRWIELRHTGENNGIGIVEWGAKESARFKERRGKTSLSLEAIRFVRENAQLDDDMKDRLDSISITNLDRLLGDKDIQDVLGLYIEDGKLMTKLQKGEVLKGLVKILKDLASKSIKVKNIYDKADRKNYIEKFNRNDIPDQTKTAKQAWSLDLPPIQDTTVKPVKPTNPVKRSSPLSTSRKTLIPSTCILKIDDRRINAIYRELKLLEVEDYKNAVSVLIRVFLELTLDHFIEFKNLKNISTNSKLATKLQTVAKHLEDNNILQTNQLKPIRIAVSSPNSLFSIDTFHSYVHNKNFAPNPIDLKTSWDNMQLFMEKIWE